MKKEKIEDIPEPTNEIGFTKNMITGYYAAACLVTVFFLLSIYFNW